MENEEGEGGEREERGKEHCVAVESLSLHHLFLSSMIPPWTRGMGSH